MYPEEEKKAYWDAQASCNALRARTETELLEDKRRKLINELQELETLISWAKTITGADDLIRRLKSVL